MDVNGKDNRRQERDTLDEMEEVARARNKDVAEEERMEALMKAEKAKAPLLNP